MLKKGHSTLDSKSSFSSRAPILFLHPHQIVSFVHTKSFYLPASNFLFRNNQGLTLTDVNTFPLLEPPNIFLTSHQIFSLACTKPFPHTITKSSPSLVPNRFLCAPIFCLCSYSFYFAHQIFFFPPPNIFHPPQKIFSLSRTNFFLPQVRKSSSLAPNLFLTPYQIFSLMRNHFLCPHNLVFLCPNRRNVDAGKPISQF